MTLIVTGEAAHRRMPPPPPEGEEEEEEVEEKKEASGGVGLGERADAAVEGAARLVTEEAWGRPEVVGG